MNTAIKYPKTFHFPFSEGLQNDDRRMENENCFNGKTVAVTIKMDGENTSLYRDGLHARSLDSRHHSSRSVIKSLHAVIKSTIPVDWRVCGENMYAKHSIHYTDLESYFYVFSVWDANNNALSLDDTLEFCQQRGLTHVPVVERVSIASVKDFWELDNCYNDAVENGQEGIVVRNVDSFHYNDFKNNVVKAVRKGHIQTSEHWMSQEVVPNLLKINE